MSSFDLISDVLPQPATERDLLLDVSASPRRTRLDAFGADVIRTSAIQRRAGKCAKCSGMNGPNNTVGMATCATP